MDAPKTTMSSIRQQFPMYADVPDDKLLIAIRQKYFPQTPPGEFYNSIDYDTTRQKLLRESAAEMSVPERIAANWSAGYGNLTQGLQQVLSSATGGALPGVSDEEVKAKRERDKILAESLPHTPGWSTGKMLQTTSEALPTVGVPVGAFATPVRVVGNAARVLPLFRNFPQAGPVTRMLMGGATGGATQSSLSPVTSDESRGVNMAMGAGIGTVIPAAGKTVPAAYGGMRKLLTKSGAQQRALENITEHLGDAAPEALEALVRGHPQPTVPDVPTAGPGTRQAVDVPTSAVQASGDPYLAQLEAASRSRSNSQPGWSQFDAARNAQLWGTLEGQTPSPLRLTRLQRARELATGPQRQAALGTAQQVQDFSAPVTQHASNLLQGDTGANPAVQTVANYVTSALGDAPTPGRLYEVRKVLAGKLSGPGAIGDELSSAAKGAQRETSEMIRVIDDALDAASNGQWRNYLTEYQRRSVPVTSARTMQSITGKMADKPYRGTTPEMTYAGLKQAVNQFDSGKYGSRLSPQDQQTLDTLLEHLRHAEAPARTRKTAATMGGGSITNTDQLLAAGMQKLIEGLPVVGGYASRVRDYNAHQVDQAMAQYLQNPSLLTPQLRALIESGNRTQRQQLYDQMLRGGALGGAAGGM